MPLTRDKLEAIVCLVKLGYNMKLKVLAGKELASESETGWLLQVYCENDPCHDTGIPITWTGRKWYISKFATDSEVILTAWKAFFTALEHEAREDFKYDGVRVFDPHVDVVTLAHLMFTKCLTQDVRTEPQG